MVYAVNDHISTLINARVRSPQQLGEMGSWLSKYVFDPIKSAVGQAASAAPAAVAIGQPAVTTPAGIAPAVPQGTPATNAAGQSLTIPPISYQLSPQGMGLPSWAIPVGLGALALLLVMSMGNSSPAPTYVRSSSRKR